MTRRILMLLAVSAASFGASLAAGQKPMTLTDVLAWKHIASPVASSDGAWFAYKVAPNDGDSTVVLKNVRDGKESRFPVGETPRVEAGDPGGAPPPPPARDVVFSEDGKWLAFTVYPTQMEARGLKKAHKPLQSKVTLIELGTGKKTEFEGIRNFAFSGERASALAFIDIRQRARGLLRLLLLREMRRLRRSRLGRICWW